MFSEENHKIKLILASKSPRRASIFNKLSLDFEIVEPELIKEKSLSNPKKTVIFNSFCKAKKTAKFIKANKTDLLKTNKKNIIIAGFDTVVFMDKKFYLKPQSLEEAKEFLELFSGNTHEVYTGVSLISDSGKARISDYDITQVTFKKLKRKDIEDYLKKEYVFDKAGAYNIDGYGSILVRKIKGCFYNVMGVPVYKFLSMMNNLGYDLKDFQR